MKHVLLLACLCANLSVFSQSNPWTRVEEATFRSAGLQRWIVPQNYKTLALDLTSLQALLARAPQRFLSGGETLALSLPMPDGSFEDFAIVESSIMHPALAAKFPEIKTFSGQGIDDPFAAVYLDLTPKGFHAMVLKPGNVFYIDPYAAEETGEYIAYDRMDFDQAKAQDFACGALDAEEIRFEPSAEMAPVGSRSTAVTLRTYDIAIAANGEYTSFHGGTVVEALAAVTTTLNRVRGIYETELAISFSLVANNDLLIYTNGASDPYSNPPTMLENQANIDLVIGSANYDIGHVMGTGTGGVASVGVVCNNAGKARGITASNSPVGDPFDIDFVAHEIGHQFGAHHSFNGNIGSCGGTNRTAATAYEPGGGGTIMAYAGLCSSQNIQVRSFTHFHRASLNEITNFITSGTGSTCPTSTPAGNSTPTVDADPNAMAGKYIPISTPFELLASGSDPDGDELTFCWEQFDLGTAGAPAASLATGPLFRSLPPVASGLRSFPSLSDVLDNSANAGEFLPSVSRDLSFQCTARDNHSIGGNASASFSMHVTNTAGPFSILTHNAPAVVNGAILLQWNVANTTASPVNCANVDILLSLNGGLSFSTLLAGTPNDGSQTITLPNTATNQARIKVKCADNLFYDINNADLRIAPSDATCAEKVADGDMEDYMGWTEFSTNGFLLIGATGTQHGGTGSAYLGGADDEISSVSQTIALPAGAHFADLVFWYKLGRTDCGNDDFTVKINGAVVKYLDLCNDPAVGDWVRGTVNLSAYIGSSPEISFEVTTDWVNPSDVFVDDVSVFVCSGGAFSLLPVDLVDFKAMAHEDRAFLSWSTESEQGNLGFFVESAAENDDFQTLGWVPGAIDAQTRHDYQFQVPGLKPGLHYFRLRQMDLDQSFTYSPIRSVVVAGEQSIRVQPNPAVEVVHFSLLLEKDSDVRLDILDNTGRVIGQVANDRFVKGQFTLSYDIGDLAEGMYYYHLTSNSAQESGRFLVVK